MGWKGTIYLRYPLFVDPLGWHGERCSVLGGGADYTNIFTVQDILRQCSKHDAFLGVGQNHSNNKVSHASQISKTKFAAVITQKLSFLSFGSKVKKNIGYKNGKFSSFKKDHEKKKKKNRRHLFTCAPATSGGASITKHHRCFAVSAKMDSRMCFAD